MAEGQDTIYNIQTDFTTSWLNRPWADAVTEKNMCKLNIVFTMDALGPTLEQHTQITWAAQ